MVVRLGLFGAVEMSVEVPFANMAGVVAFFSQKFRKGDFTFSKVAGMASRDPAPDAVSIRGASCEN